MNTDGNSSALAAGLRKLRSKDLFCDAVLSAGGKSFSVHQAVLAALSPPLRKYITSNIAETGGHGADGLESLKTAPHPVKLQFDSLSGPEAVQAMINHVYGEADTPAVGNAAPVDLRNLAGAFSLPGLVASPAQADTKSWSTAVTAGFRKLRSRGILCDLDIKLGDQHFPAHQVALAAVSSVFCTHFMNSRPQVGTIVLQEIVSQPLGLELDGITHAEAIRAMLDHIYAGPGAAAEYRPSTEDVNLDVLQLAVTFELPRLEEQAEAWAARNARAVGPAAYEGYGSPVRTRPPHEGARASPARGAEDTEVQEPGASIVEGRPRPDDSTNAEGPATAEVESSLMLMHMKRFSSDDTIPTIPADVERWVERSIRNRQEAKVLEQLREMFSRRPIWLEGCLLQQLPAGLQCETLWRFLPSVAYQWADGPWRNAFTRLGWDPRKHPEEAKWLQVLQFRDPHLRGAAGAPKASAAGSGNGGAEAMDVSFSQPPVLPNQAYQLIDIRDDFIMDILGATDLLDPCTSRTGWLPPIVLEAIRGRLSVKSQQMREQIAARAEAKAKGAGDRPAKRLRSGGC